jgi:hypothetical protein
VKGIFGIGDTGDWAGQKSLQGLKPIDVIGFIGTTEVEPCYKTSEWAGHPPEGLEISRSV